MFPAFSMFVPSAMWAVIAWLFASLVLLVLYLRSSGKQRRLRQLLADANSGLRVERHLTEKLTRLKNWTATQLFVVLRLAEQPDRSADIETLRLKCRDMPLNEAIAALVANRVIVREAFRIRLAGATNAAVIATEMPDPQPLSVQDYVQLARSFAWVACEAVYTARDSKHYGTDHEARLVADSRKEINHAIASAIDKLDEAKASLADSSHNGIPVSGVVGLPPTGSLQRLCECLVACQGCYSFAIGSSAFTHFPRLKGREHVDLSQD